MPRSNRPSAGTCSARRQQDGPRRNRSRRASLSVRHRAAGHAVRPSAAEARLWRSPVVDRPSAGRGDRGCDGGARRRVRRLRCRDRAGWPRRRSRRWRTAAKWELPDPANQPSSETLSQYLKDHAATSSGGRGGRTRWHVARIDRRGAGGGQDELSAAYDVAYIQHAPMEPRAAVAEWQDGKLTVWTGTQNPMRVRGELMEAFHLAGDRVRVIVPDAGGGFGGKHTGEVALEAARLAKGCGQAGLAALDARGGIHLGLFPPGRSDRSQRRVGRAGRLSAWKFVNYNSGGSALETPYTVPNMRTQFVACEAPLRSGSYRALASTANTFARECFMDELARRGRVDPLDVSAGASARPVDCATCSWRRPREFDWSGRAKQTVRTVASGWPAAPKKARTSRRASKSKSIARSGNVKVQHVCQAFECGAIQNPAESCAQVEGCMIMGLGARCSERIDFAEGKISQRQFLRVSRAAAGRSSRRSTPCSSIAATCPRPAPAKPRSSPSPRPSPTPCFRPPASGFARCRW